MTEEKFEPTKKETPVSPEAILIAEKSLREFLKLKQEERVLFLKDKKTNPETALILEQAVQKIGSPVQEFIVDEKTKRKEIQELLKKTKVVIDLTIVEEVRATDKLYDEDIIKYGNRLLCLVDLDPDAFRENGPLTESLEDLEYRLNKMEAVLKEATGFRITSGYGTNLEVGLRPFKERRWCKDTGVIDRPGQWDNLPGGEVFTTPDERNVNGTLVLPVLESTIIREQGVDEFVRVNIKNGAIVSIQGGKSAEKLRRKLEEDAREEHKEGGNPLNVYQVAEIAFGANSKARSSVVDPEQPYNSPSVSVVETEKRLGTMHIAFGSTKHGEVGAEGFLDALSHYDFVIPRNSLTVEMFSGEKDWKKKKNGRKIISNGGLNFF